MNVPKLSIIVPVYNAAPYLHRCIDSIISQTFTDFELLLIDDGSSDDSGKICEEYASCWNNIRVFHQINSGPGVARNRGIENSRGEWITFVDADDSVTSEYLRVIVEKGMNADLTFFSSDECFEEGSIISRVLQEGTFKTVLEREEAIYKLKQNEESFEYFGYTWNKVFCSSIIKENHIRFVEGLSLCEDEIFTAEYCRYISSINTIPNRIYSYRRSLSGLTGRRKTVWQYRTYANYLMKYAEQWRNRNLLKIDITRCVRALFALINNEVSLVSLFADIKQLRLYELNHKCYIDYSLLTNKQRIFLLGKGSPFILRKILRCCKSKVLCQSS